MRTMSVRFYLGWTRSEVRTKGRYMKDRKVARRMLVAALTCLVVTGFVVWAVFFVAADATVSSERKRQALVLIVGVVLVGGLLAVIVAPLVIVRSVWALAIVLIAIPMYANSIFYAANYVPYWRAWWRCGHQPVILVSFAAAGSYHLPGEPGYSPSFLGDSYVCTEEEARARGFQHIP